MILTIKVVVVTQKQRPKAGKQEEIKDKEGFGKDREQKVKSM
jgi:hypothetical protein